MPRPLEGNRRLTKTPNYSADWAFARGGKSDVGHIVRPCSRTLHRVLQKSAFKVSESSGVRFNRIQSWWGRWWGSRLGRSFSTWRSRGRILGRILGRKISLLNRTPGQAEPRKMLQLLTSKSVNALSSGRRGVLFVMDGRRANNFSLCYHVFDLF